MPFVYIVEFIKPCDTYWSCSRVFANKDVADAWCKYKQEYETEDGARWRVVKEEVI